MPRIPTETEIRTEMTSIGGNDYFAAQSRLQYKFDEADRAVENLKPATAKTDHENWAMEPTADQILFEAKQFGLTPETARENLRKKLAADAKRLAAFSVQASEEISEALAEAEAARERAANVLVEHQAALVAVTNGILALGQLRRKIAVVRSLSLNAADERALANRAFEFFMDKHTASETVQNTTGFRAFAEDLALRQALTPHIASFVAPLEKQAMALIASVRAQAADAKMDLKKVMELLAGERGQRGGESLLHDPALYAGLL